MISSNNNLVNIVDGLVEEKIDKIDTSKENSKIKKKFRKIIITIIITFILAFNYCLFFRESYINESNTFHKTPSFPFISFSFLFNQNLNKELKMDCHVWFRKNNGTLMMRKLSKIDNFKPSYILGMIPLTLTDLNILYIYFKVFENDYNKLKNISVHFLNEVYTLNSNNKIDDRFQIFKYEIDEEVSLSNKNKETKVYIYEVQSKTIKDGNRTENFPFIKLKDVKYVPFKKDSIFDFGFQFIKGEGLQTLEVTSISFKEIFFLILGSVEFIIDILPIIYGLIRKKRVNTIEINNSNRINLPLNEINNNNNDIIDELNNPNN